MQTAQDEQPEYCVIYPMYYRVSSRRKHFSVLLMMEVGGWETPDAVPHPASHGSHHVEARRNRYNKRVNEIMAERTQTPTKVTAT